MARRATQPAPRRGRRAIRLTPIVPMLSHGLSHRNASRPQGEQHNERKSGRIIGLRRPINGRARVAGANVSGPVTAPDNTFESDAAHIPVLGREAIDYLNVRDGGIYIDGTFGGGGYTRAILGQADCRVIAIDRDQTAIAAGADLVEAAKGRLTLVEDQFSNLDQVAQACGVEQVDGVVLDLGVSSMQLDRPERGFSFRFDGPLDMRMSSSGLGGDGPSAADVVAQAGERDLANIIFQLGEERHSRGVARAILKARAETPITTTAALARVIGSVVRSRPNEIHPATRTFQALRIFVNDELGELVAALTASERILKTGGRLVAVSFHSLEDRIVKSFLVARGEARAGSRHLPQAEHPDATFQSLTKRPVTAGDDETARNPRARSAKLRAAARTDAPAQKTDLAELLPRLPSLHDALKGR